MILSSTLPRSAVCSMANSRTRARYTWSIRASSWIHKWKSDLRFYLRFNSISAMPGRWEVDNESLLWNPVYGSKAGIEYGTVSEMSR